MLPLFGILWTYISAYALRRYVTNRLRPIPLCYQFQLYFLSTPPNTLSYHTLSYQDWVILPLFGPKRLEVSAYALIGYLTKVGLSYHFLDNLGIILAKKDKSKQFLNSKRFLQPGYNFNNFYQL